MLFLQKNLAENCGEKRTDTNDNTYVRCVCVINRYVFKKLVKYYSRKTCKRKKNIIADCYFFKARTKNPEPDIGSNKSVKKNFKR